MGGRYSSLTSIDCDGDGNNNILSYNGNNRTCFLARSGTSALANGVTVAGAIPNFSSTSTAVAVGDNNGDGYDDFIVGTNNSTTDGRLSALYIFLSTSASGTVSFSIKTAGAYNLPLPNPNISWHGKGAALALYDYDGDVLADLFALASSGNRAFVFLYRALSPDNPNTAAFPFDTAWSVIIQNLSVATPIASSAGQLVSSNFICADAVSGIVSEGPTEI